MSAKTYKLLLFVACAVGAVLVAGDLITDSKSGGTPLHLISELLILVIFVAGLVFLGVEHFKLKARLQVLNRKLVEADEQARIWKQNHSTLIQGLSVAIDNQLKAWKLTDSEKEIARLLIKGLSHKEIASIRSSAEKTVRTHAASIYQKSSLHGRAELSAFFLEDLLAPISKRA